MSRSSAGRQLLIIFSALFILMILNPAHAGTLTNPSRSVLNRIENSYDSKITFFQADKGSSLSGCRLQAVYVTGRDPVNGGQRNVEIKQYLPTTADAHPEKAIILIPPTGGENIFDNKHANAFCDQGFRVVLIQRWNLFESADMALEAYDQEALRVIAAIRHSIEFLQQTGASSIGIFGTSLGAIQASFILGFDPRIKAGVLIVGGINLPDIIAQSTEKTLMKMREIRMQAWNMTQAQYALALKKAITIEPADFIGMTGTKPSLVIVGTKDTTVPTENQMLLMQALETSEVIYVPKDHFNTIKTAASMSHRFVDFFKKYL